LKSRPYLLAGVSGVLQFFIFPNFLGLESGLVAWVAMVPLLIALESADSARKAAIIAAVSGLVGYPLLYHWLVYTMHTYGNMGYPVSVFVLIAMVLLLSAFLALFGAASHILVRKAQAPFYLVVPLVWVAVEYLRAHFPFGGFPWALIGYSQHGFLPIIQISEITGPYGVSTLVMFVNAALAGIVIEWKSGPTLKAAFKSRWRLVSTAVLLPLIISALGYARMKSVDKAFQSQPEVKVGIVQANVDQAVKWSSDYFWQTMYDHLDLTYKVMRDEPRLVIWPEAAVTVSGFNKHWESQSPVIQLLTAVDAYFLVGAMSKDEEGGVKKYYNSAYLLTPGAEQIVARYDKMRLVPFSEYVPLQKLFFFADAIAQGNTGGSSPGDEVRVMSLPEARFGCVICYEVIFPHIVRKFVDQGASFMTTITNDAWFGKTGAPYQHHMTVQFRSVENRVYFARSANTGISSIVDPNGRIVKSTDLYVKAWLSGSVRPSPVKTFYSRFGDVFAWSVILLTIVIAGGAIIRLRRTDGSH